MDLTQSVTAAIQSSDYARLSSIFSSSRWQSLGQGEQRALSAHFVKSAIASPSFLPSAFRSSDTMSVISTTLNHLPPSVEGAADSVLRHKIFEYMVNDVGDYGTAARFLSGLRMEESDEGSAYYLPPVERCDVFVKVAECYLEEDLTVEAEGAVAKAGTIIESSGIGIGIGIGGTSASSSSSLSSDPEKDEAGRDERTVTLILRYKSTYARVLDTNRKFLQAAVKYHDLSTAHTLTDAVDADDLLVMLGRAVTCAILSPNSAQRQR
jgi:COP9 signalosome complex subunit 4